MNERGHFSNCCPQPEPTRETPDTSWLELENVTGSFGLADWVRRYLSRKREVTTSKIDEALNPWHWINNKNPWYMLAAGLKRWCVNLGPEYDASSDRYEVPELHGANAVSSEIQGKPGYHKLAIDLDVPAVLIPSSTPGHSHLYIDKEMSWRQYNRVLRALNEAGILEPGYVKVSRDRKATFLRVPWERKSFGDYLKEEA